MTPQEVAAFADGLEAAAMICEREAVNFESGLVGMPELEAAVHASAAAARILAGAIRAERARRLRRPESATALMSCRKCGGIPTMTRHGDAVRFECVPCHRVGPLAFTPGRAADLWGSDLAAADCASCQSTAALVRRPGAHGTAWRVQCTGCGRAGAVSHRSATALSRWNQMQVQAMEPA